MADYGLVADLYEALPELSASVCARQMTHNAHDGADVTGPRSLTRLLGLFDVLSMSPDGLSLAELNVTLDRRRAACSTCCVRWSPMTT